MTHPSTADKTDQTSIYGVVSPQATYRPWTKDSEFQRVYSAIRSSTLVDEYRCFELWNLVEQSAKLERGALIEIGAWRGGTGALIGAQAVKCGIEDPVYLCDTFKGVVKAGPMDSAYEGGEHSDTTLQAVEELLRRMSLRNVRILSGIFPDETGDDVADNEFRFCHVDVDVYLSAKDIVDWVWHRMVRGGIIVFDDYGFYSCDGITKYVESHMNTSDRIFMHNLNGHAVVIKL
jgi:O-methyltransferase